MSQLTRRTVVRGSAWSVPVIAAVAPIPAFATSLRKDPGINGWVRIEYGTDYGFNVSFDSDPAGTDGSTPDGAPYGLYLYDINVGPGNTIADVITNVSIVLWFRGNVGSWTTESSSSTPNGGGHGSWSAPQSIGTAVKPDGLTYTGYRFTYSGTFALGDGNTRVYLQDFGVTARNVDSGDATFWVERRVTVNGVAKSFQRRNGERGALGNGFPGGSSFRRAADAAVLA